MGITQPSGTASWSQIGRQVLGSPAASVSFASISTGYNEFLLKGWAQADVNAAKTMTMRFNNDSTNVYAYNTLTSISSVIAGAQSTAQSSGLIGDYNDNTVTSFSYFQIRIQNTTASMFKQYFSEIYYYNGASTKYISGQWYNASPAEINRIDLLASANNFATGSVFDLWGTKI